MAPRWLLRVLHKASRGAGLALCLGLAGQAAAQEITGASYSDPTDRYPHGVLGDDLEWGTLNITFRPGSGQSSSTFEVVSPDRLVFEDLEPRLWDITGDGSPEVVAIQSHQQFGARLLVIGVVDGQPGFLAEVPFIGTRFRWLAPVGAADFDGDGRIEVAFVDRPHLAKTLRVFEWNGSELVLDPEIADVTNHRIGEDFISSGVRDCGSGPEMVMANATRSQVVVVSGFDGQWQVREAGPWSQNALAATLECQG